MSLYGLIIFAARTISFNILLFLLFGFISGFFAHAEEGVANRTCSLVATNKTLFKIVESKSELLFSILPID